MASNSVSNRPIWLVDAPPRSTALPPTIHRIAGSRPSRSASFTSSYPGETTIDGLAKETDDAVPTVLAGPAVSNNVTGQRGQAEGFVQFTIGEQTSV